MIVWSIGVLVSVFRLCQKNVLSRRKRLTLNQLDLYQKLRSSRIKWFYELNRLMSNCYHPGEQVEINSLKVRPPHWFRLLSRLWGDHFKWTKKTHLTLSSIPPFIVTILAFVEYTQSLISRPDQFCSGKYLVAPTFETSIQRVFMGFLWFFKLSHNMFHLSLAESKTGCSKIGPSFLSTFG